MIQDVRNYLRLEKKNESKVRILRAIKNLSEYKKEEGNHYKPVIVSNAQSNNYIEYESSGDRNKTLSVKEYIKKIKSYLKDIIYNLKNFGTWKIQLTIANNFISFLNNDEERVTHSKGDNIEIMINDEADEVMKERFDLLKYRY